MLIPSARPARGKESTGRSITWINVHADTPHSMTGKPPGQRADKGFSDTLSTSRFRDIDPLEFAPAVEALGKMPGGVPAEALPKARHQNRSLRISKPRVVLTRHVPPQPDFVRDALSITDRKETDDSIDIGMQGRATLNAHESVSLP